MRSLLRYFIKVFPSVPKRIAVKSYLWLFKTLVLHSAKDCNRTAIYSIESAQITKQEKDERSDGISICNPSRAPFYKGEMCQAIYAELNTF